MLYTSKLNQFWQQRVPVCNEQEWINEMYKRERVDWRECPSKRGKLQVTQQCKGPYVDQWKSERYTKVESESQEAEG